MRCRCCCCCQLLLALPPLPPPPPPLRATRRGGRNPRLNEPPCPLGSKAAPRAVSTRVRAGPQGELRPRVHTEMILFPPRDASEKSTRTGKRTLEPANTSNTSGRCPAGY
eukprot:5729001-Lingulodinium_polyedra.AAC.1